MSIEESKSDVAKNAWCHQRLVIKYGRYFVTSPLGAEFDITNQMPHMKNKIRMLTELLTPKDADIVFKCDACCKPIVRDSRDHDDCICDENGERWWCVDCYDHYQQYNWPSSP